MESEPDASIDDEPDEDKEKHVYEAKYLTLKRKCELLQQTNEKLVNRLHHVKKCTKRYKKERRLLQRHLDKMSDPYTDATVPVFKEEIGTEGDPHGYMRAPAPAARQAGPRGQKPTVTADESAAFFLFCQHRSPQLQRDYYQVHQRELTGPELTQKLTRMWCSLSAADKQPYMEWHTTGSMPLALGENTLSLGTITFKKEEG